jgi:signal transduction histidine kinase
MGIVNTGLCKIARIEIANEADVVRARQQARRIGTLLGFDALDQARIGSNVLEACRHALLSAGGGQAEFSLDPAAPAFGISISTRGAGAAAVELGRLLPAGSRVTPELVTSVTAALAEGVAVSALEELRQQDVELTSALQEQRLLELELERCRVAERAVRAKAEAASLSREHVLAVVSHDLRNPLFALTNGAFLLERVTIEGKDGDRVRKSAKMMRRAVDRMDHLISDLLDVEQLQAGTLMLEQQAEDADTLVREAVEVCAADAADRRLRVDVSAPANLRVRCDRQRVLQVFSKLLTNAIKFTAEGGSISVSAQPVEREMQFSIRDTGRGIADEELPHLFDRFWQAKKRSRNGIGLSLSLVKGLVEAHGGSIGVETQPGVGTEFRFTLPLAEAPLAESSLAESSPAESPPAESPLGEELARAPGRQGAA